MRTWLSLSLRGIKLSQKVFETTLKKSTEVKQWLKVDKVTGELIPGNYYTLPGAEPNKLGISLEGRVKIRSVLNEDTKFYGVPQPILRILGLLPARQ